MTLVVEGAAAGQAEDEWDDEAIAEKAAELLARGLSPRDAADELAALTGRARREVAEELAHGRPQGIVAAADQRQDEYGQRAAIERHGGKQPARGIPLALGGVLGLRPAQIRKVGDQRHGQPQRQEIAGRERHAGRDRHDERAGKGAGRRRQPTPSEPGKKRGERREQQEHGAEERRAARRRVKQQRGRQASAEADEKTDWHVLSCPAVAVRDAAAVRASWSQPFDKWGPGSRPASRYLIT